GTDDELVVAGHREKRDRPEVVLERSPREIERDEREDHCADRHVTPEAPEDGNERHERDRGQSAVDGARQKRESTVDPEPYEADPVGSERTEHWRADAIEEGIGVVDH